MARINIPRSEYGVLGELANLEDLQFDELFSALKEIEPGITQLDFSSLLSQKAKSVKISDLKSFLRTLFSLYRIMDAREKSADQVSNDVTETIGRERPNNFPIEKLGVLRERIQKLLDVGGVVAVVAKAASVMGEQDRIFLAVRVLSDIRPVFANGQDSVAGAVVAHSLSIHYVQDGDHKDFFVTLSEPDLKVFKEAMERAQEKSKTLKSILENSKVRYFESE